MIPPLQNPKSWNDVSLSLWQEFKEICEKEWDSDIEFQIEILSLFWDCAPDDPFFDTLSYEELKLYFGEFNWINHEISKTPQKEIKIQRTDYFLKEFNTITLGEYIDMTIFLKDSEKNLPLICACLWRKKKHDEWGNEQYEPYIFDIHKRAKEFEKIPISWCYGVIENYIEWVNGIVKSYPNLFADEDWDKIEGEDQLPPEEVIQIKKEIEREKKIAPHSWLGIVWSLSGECITNFDGVFNSSAILVFNTLSMRKSLKV